MSTIALAVVLAAMPMVTAIPILNGQVEQSFVNPAWEGFTIPQEYYSVRSYLQSHGANAVLLPSIQPYIETTWGYHGASRFYLSFNYPSQVAVPAIFGEYNYYYNSTRLQYYAMTNPLLAGPSTFTPSVSWTQNYSVISPGWLRYTFQANSTAINLGGAEWLKVSFKIGNPGVVESALIAANIWVGLIDARGHTATYFLGSNSGAGATMDSHGYLNASLLLGGANYRGSFSPQLFNRIYFWIRQPVPGFQEVTGVAGISAAQSTQLNESWLRTIVVNDSYSYVVVDKSLTFGVLQGDQYINATVASFPSALGIAPIFNGTYLSLYRLAVPPLAPALGLGTGPGPPSAAEARS